MVALHPDLEPFETTLRSSGISRGIKNLAAQYGIDPNEFYNQALKMGLICLTTILKDEKVYLSGSNKKHLKLLDISTLPNPTPLHPTVIGGNV